MIEGPNSSVPGLDWTRHLLPRSLSVAQNKPSFPAYLVPRFLVLVPLAFKGVPELSASVL